MGDWANGTDSCLVYLKNINLLYIMDMIQFHAVRFDGGISGKVHLRHVLQDPVMETRLDVKDFSLNHALLGRADILGSWDKELEVCAWMPTSVATVPAPLG